MAESNSLPGKLSRTPSVAVRQAIADLRSVETDPAYAIDMRVWHSFQKDRCAVCMAGAVMARRLDVEPTSRQIWATIKHEDYLMLLALNEFRRGKLRSGLACLRLYPNMGIYSGVDDVEVPNYSAQRAGFYAGMDRVVESLEAAGL